MSKNPNLIFDIARGSFVDAPGIRTTIFFKGCPLDCPWCHNPESKSYVEEFSLSQDECISCGRCHIGKDCYTNARRVIGKAYTPEELLKIIIEDKAYYNESNGGVTFSGGEALSFIPYLSNILPALKIEGIHVAFQTCGYFDYQQFEAQIKKYTDLIYFDFKIFNKERHQKILGKSNDKILHNFEKLLSCDIKLIPRIPLIPGYTATKENLKNIALYLNNHNIQECEFLYHNPLTIEDKNPDDTEINKSLIKYFKSILRKDYDKTKK